MKPTVRHRMAVSSLIATVIVCALAASVGRAAPSQDRDEAQEQELMSLSTIIAAALRGQIVPTEEPFGWANDALKAYDKQTFVPFTLSVEQSKISTPTVNRPCGESISPRTVSARSTTAVLDSAMTKPNSKERWTVSPTSRSVTSTATAVSPTWNVPPMTMFRQM